MENTPCLVSSTILSHRIPSSFQNSRDAKEADIYRPSVVSSKTGQVVKGMGVVHEIEGAKVDKSDKPITDISIISISMQFGD